MSIFRRNSRSTVKLATLALVFLFSFSLYGLYCINTVSQVKINGPYYNRIVQGKDVIADILPPPEYLMETYLTVFELLHSDDAAKTSALIEKAKRLKADYLDRHAYWESHLPEDGLKAALVRDSYAPALRMLTAVESEFLPAILSGDNLLAAKILNERITPAYREHRARIDGTVELAGKRNKQDEAAAAVAVESRTYGQIVLGILMFIMLSVFSSYVLQRIDAEKPEEGKTA